MLQAERTGLSTAHAKALLTGVWLTTKNGKEFQASLAEKGWMLARGDRRDFVAIDAKGGVHSIARRIDGARAADVRERFADIDPRDLKSVAEAKQVQRKGAGERDQDGMMAPRIKEPRLTPKAGHQRESSGPIPGAGKAVKLAGSALSALMGEKPAVKAPSSSPKTPDTTPSPRRQELMRQLSREIPQETERDAEIEVDRGRQRDRG
jgi:hypothetical protein